MHLFETKSSQKKTNVWSSMKKHKLSTWKHMGYNVKLSAGDKVMELQEDRSSGPYLRKWWWDASQGQRTTSKKAISQYEFPVVIRSMFAADGTMMHCSMKSNLMIILENLSVKMAFGAPKRMNPCQLSVRNWHSRTCEGYPGKGATAQIKVAVGDAVVSYSQLTIQMTLKLVKTCVHVADHFITVVLLKYSDSDNLRLIFDRYNVPLCLKMATRVSRQGGQQPDSHCITDGTCAGFCFLQTQKLHLLFLSRWWATSRQMEGI